ncbi:MAG: MTH938/NDUFAF3 family protein [Candidatus Bathyarchaeia archaeon]
MIDRYEFGLMVVSGRRYGGDLILYRDMVVDDRWWRREGHRLNVEDLRDALERWRPKVLIVGTGYYGLMEIPVEAMEYLESRGVSLIAANTEKACSIYNEKLKLNEEVMGAFHLTC